MRVKMSGKGVAFRIDVILQSVNELRQEKQALEQRYAEEKYRSKNLEMKIEQERVKFCQSRDRNSKMQETVKLAQEKVRQTDSQAERLNEINDAKQKVIADLNEKIKQEIDKQENDVTEFQLKLSELTQFFRDAKRAYASDNLTKESKEWKESMDAVMNEAETKNIELEDVTKAFENLSVDTNKIKELVGEKMGHKGLTYKELKTAMDQLTRKKEQLHKFLKWLESCENDAKAEIQEKSRRRVTAEQERGNSVGETEIADVIVRDISPERTCQNTQATREGQRFPNASDHIPAKNVIDQEARNHYTAPNQNTVPDIVPAHVPERESNVDQGSHHAVPAASRTVPAHIAAVNSPSFFISLPFGRTR